jgi:hypothetical protein
MLVNLHHNLTSTTQIFHYTGLIPYGEEFVDECLDGTKGICNESLMKVNVTEKQPLDVNYTFYGQNYSSVYVSLSDCYCIST